MEVRIPSYMHPVFRFLQANGDLKVAKDGAAFNLAGGLLDLAEEDFPLIIRGSVPLETVGGTTFLSVAPFELRREDLLRAACDLIDSGNAVMLGSSHKEVEKLVHEWRAKLARSLPPQPGTSRSPL